MKTFYIFTFCLLSLLLSAQQTPILERKISVSLQNERLANALLRISQEGRFSFSYNATIISTEQTVTLEAKAKSVRDVLNEIFGTAMDYKERNDHLILTKKPVKPEYTTVIIVSGYVEDAQTKEKIVDASVYDKKSITSVVTDEYGYFKMRLDKKGDAATIAVSKKDYRDTLLTITAPSDQYLNIAIAPVKKDTVVVTANTAPVDTTKKIEELKVEEKKPEVLSLPYDDEPNVQNISDTLYRDIQISFLPFLGSNGRLSGNIINNYSINMLGGYSLGTQQLELGFFFNIDRGNVKWLQIAGFGNMVGGNVMGVQAAGFFNVNGGSTVAAQGSGFANINFKDFSGVQVSGFGNVNMQGVHGVSVAGFANVTRGKSRGVQVAGFGNVQNGDFKGSQVAGFSNIATGHLDGSQVSAFFNYGRKVRGGQVAFMNYADSLGGVPVGFLSIVKSGYHKLELSADEVFYSNLAFRSGVRQFYNIIMAGMQTQLTLDNKAVWTFGYGIGTAPKLTKWMDLNIDLISQHVNKGGFTDELSMLNKFYLGLDFHVAKKFSITTGITLNNYLTRSSYTDYPTLFTDFKPRLIDDHTFDNGTNMKMWWGAKVGFRFF